MNVKYHNIIKAWKSRKKIKKKSGEDGCSQMHRYKGGGWVYPAHANTRNGVNGDIQRFATLV